MIPLFIQRDPMRKICYFLICSFYFYSCIPLKIAPQINDYRISRGSKFSKELSDRSMFLFEDPKAAGEFYDYVNTKFQLDGVRVYDDVPFTIGEEQYFFAFYEIALNDKILNLFPAIIFAALDAGEVDGGDEILSRTKWYVAIEVYSDNEKDCLAADSLSGEVVLQYLRAIKGEYLSTDNYNEFVLKD